MPNSTDATSARCDPQSRLNPQQRAVVAHEEGPLLVLAGAGTGKTRALTARLADLIRSRRTRPWQILAVTFTNKAAREMRERVAAQLDGDDALRPDWMGTFHALSTRILRRHAELAGLTPDFAILDRDDSTRLLKDVLQDLGVDQKQWTPRAAAAWIDRWKNQALGPDSVPEEEADTLASGKGTEVYAEYARRLKSLNAADFGDLIMHAIRIFQQHKEVALRYGEQFEHVLVDEYQDVNVAQYLWLRLIAGSGANLCCVGDDDQAIYGWRGARVEHILRFERDFPGAKVIRLEQNYRSTSHILSAGSNLLRANRARLGKTLWSDLGDGRKVLLGSFADGAAEAKWIAEEIERLTGRRGPDCVPPNEIAVLVRASFLMSVLEAQLSHAAIPYRIVGGFRFYERAEIRDAVAYLQLAAYPHAYVAFGRVANQPRRGVGPVSVDAVRREGRRLEAPVVVAVEAAVDGARVRGRAAASLRTLADQIRSWQEACASGLPPSRLAERILDETGYLAMLENERTPESAGRIENLQELLSSLEEHDRVDEFLERVSLTSEDDSDAGSDRISLMTIHAAKGLEFDTVFLPAWEDEVFPHPRAVEERGQEGMEEERRTAHVAVTRARRTLAITHAARRLAFGSYQYRSPSTFLSDIPESCVERVDDGFDLGLPSASRLESAAATASQYLSPGWSRMRKNLPRASDGVARLPRETAIPRFDPGERVFHKKFGYGEVQETDAKHVQVAFETGVKTVLANFLAPAAAA